MTKHYATTVSSSFSKHTLVTLLALFFLSACANLNTINRETSLPKKGEAKAIHLDIQQRLLIVNALGQYCAEPSPDGLAAFAAAIGLGASSPTSSAATASGSTGSSAASIGLRTQSITLMRDELYRVCEAHANGAIGSAHVAVLLGRSQDLTAVILAIEQLTGPVVASQATLNAGAESITAASLVTTTEQLEIAVQRLDRANVQLEAAMVEKASLESELESISTEIATKAEARDALAADATAQKTQMDRDIQALNQKKATTEAKLAAATTSVTFRQNIVNDATASKEKAENQQDTAFVSASTSTSGRGSFSARTAQTLLSNNSTAAITKAVDHMVTEVLAKSYLEEACISLMTTEPRQKLGADGQSLVYRPMTDGEKKLYEQCVSLINASVERAEATANKETEVAKQNAAVAKLNTLQTNQLASIAEQKSDLERVMACITAASGDVDANRLRALMQVPQLNTAVSQSIVGRDAAEIRQFLAQRSDQRQELAARVDNDISVCVNQRRPQ